MNIHASANACKTTTSGYHPERHRKVKVNLTWPFAAHSTQTCRLLHLHQNTEQDPSALSTRLMDRSSGMPCFLPKGSMSSSDNFSQIGPISSFDTAIGGLSNAGCGCRMAKRLLLDRPIIRWCLSCSSKKMGSRMLRYRSATGSESLHCSSLFMHAPA